MQWNGVIAKIILHDLDLLFEGQQFKLIISLKWRVLAHKKRRFGYMPIATNNTIARFTHNDIYRPFQSKKYEILISPRQ